MKRLILVGLATLALGSTLQARSKFTTHKSYDEFTKKTYVNVCTRPTRSKTRMNFPYGGTKAVLCMYREGGESGVYMQFTNKPNLTNSAIHNGYSTNTQSVAMFGNRQPARYRIMQEWGERVLFLETTSFWKDDLTVFVENLQKAKIKTFKIRLPWYGNQGVQFNFKLKGMIQKAKKLGIIRN